MRVLFLDMDGVLNSGEWYRERQKLSNGTIRPPDEFFPDEDGHTRRQLWEIDPKALAVLRRIIEDYGLKIVISSTWRIGEELDTFSYLFGRLGWKVPFGTIIGKTPYTQKGFRGDEVDHWLKNSASEPVEAYVILDDDSDFHFHQKPNLVKTSHLHGLDETHYKLVGITLDEQVAA